jgi:DNA-binding NarL/FixJ family response regulator
MIHEPAVTKDTRPKKRAGRSELPEGWELVTEYVHEGRRYAVLRARGHASALTLRERQILARAALGQTNKVIAYELGLSASTVRVFMARAFVRLGARNRAEAIEIFRATVTRSDDDPDTSP